MRVLRRLPIVQSLRPPWSHFHAHESAFSYLVNVELVRLEREAVRKMEEWKIASNYSMPALHACHMLLVFQPVNHALHIIVVDVDQSGTSSHFCNIELNDPQRVLSPGRVIPM